MAEWLSEIWNSGTQNQPKNDLKACWTSILFNFCLYFAIFDDFSKFPNTFAGVLPFEKSSNIAKISTQCWQQQTLIKLWKILFLDYSHPSPNAVSYSADSDYAVFWGCPKIFALRGFVPKYTRFFHCHSKRVSQGMTVVSIITLQETLIKLSRIL